MDEFLEDFEDDSEIEEMIQEIEDSDMKQSLDQYFTMALEMSACAALALFSLHCREAKRWLLRRELLQKCRNNRKRFSPVQIRINGLLETVQLEKPEKSEFKSTKIKTTKGLMKIKIKKPLSCKFCGDRFSHRTSALRHENKRSCGHILNSTKTGFEREEINKIEVNKGEDLSCTFCQATFKTSRYYDRHMATSHLQCEYCPQNFRYKYYLDRHLPMHTDIRSHICNMCVEVLLITDPLFLSMKGDHIRLYNSSAPTAENPSRTSFIFQIIPAIRIEKGEGKPQICMVDNEIKQIF